MSIPRLDACYGAPPPPPGASSSYMAYSTDIASSPEYQRAYDSAKTQAISGSDQLSVGQTKISSAPGTIICDDGSKIKFIVEYTVKKVAKRDPKTGKYKEELVKSSRIASTTYEDPPSWSRH